MATCQTTRWVSTSPYVKLTVTAVGTTETSVTLSYTLKYISDTPADTSGNKSYTVVINNKQVEGGAYDINGKTGEHEICSGQTVIYKTKAAQTITCGCAFQFDLYWSNVFGGTKTAQTTINVEAKKKYTITYNANGGSGTPSAQIKWYGEAITLSSTKPTRTGYSFQGWATSSTGAVVYKAGTSYTANASITLYAVWKANTYTITYNANGGSNAPAAQTKTYGVNLTLATSKPTRTNYTFKGWSRTSNGAVAYQPGATYTSNAAITLYAVWELSYFSPKIYNAKAEWVESENLLTNAAGTFVSGTDSNYGYQNLLSSACSSLGLFNGKAYTLTFDWAVNWGGKTPVTNVEVRVGYGEDYGDFDGVSASKTIPNLSTKTSGTFNFTFTHYTGPYSNERAVPAMIQAIYCSSKDALDGTTWTISNVKLAEEDKISVAFDWETTNSNPTGNLWFYNADGSTAHNVSLGQLSGNSGRFEHTIAASEANSINIDTSYVVEITLSDGGGNTTTAVTLTGNTYAIDFLVGGKGVAFGGAASLEDTAHFQWAAKFDKAVYGNVPGMNRLPEIPANDDFNNYMTTGCWAVYRNDNAETIAHIPVARAGRLEVWSSTGEGIRAEQWSYLRQRYIPYDSSNATWERDITRGENNAWTYYDWHRTTLTPEASKKIYATKQYLTATITTNVAMTAVNTYTIIPLKKYKLYSGGLSLTTDGAVEIGAGISMVKVSGQVLVKCGATAGNRHVKIQIVSATGTVTDVAWCCVTGSAGDNLVFPFTPTILTVSEGETLRFAYYTPDSSDAAQKGGNGYQTYIMVEEF